jgi:hypothetical protein
MSIKTKQVVALKLVLTSLVLSFRYEQQQFESPKKDRKDISKRMTKMKES